MTRFLHEKSLPVLTYTMNIWRTLEVDENNIVTQKFLTQILRMKLTRIMINELINVVRKWFGSQSPVLFQISFYRAFLVQGMHEMTSTIEAYMYISLVSYPGPLRDRRGERASYPRPREEGEKAYSRLRYPRFLGVVGACTCSRYQALFPPPSGPGYEANMYMYFQLFDCLLPL